MVPTGSVPAAPGTFRATHSPELISFRNATTSSRLIVRFIGGTRASSAPR